MFIIDGDQCKKCKLCVKECPVGAIEIKKAGEQTVIEITDHCVECGICRRVCKFDAILLNHANIDVAVCSSCPIQCKVPVGATGACTRYRNVDGKLVRDRALVSNQERCRRQKQRFGSRLLRQWAQALIIPAQNRLLTS